MRFPYNQPRTGALLAFVLSAAACSGPAPIREPYRDTKLPPDRRATDLMGRMTPDEKQALARGAETLSIQANTRLGIPAVRTVDGAMGVSAKDPSGHPIFATAFPANIGMGATWNQALMEQVGVVIAQQALALGRGQVIGPLADVGRSFEAYSEDPWLVSRMVVGYVSGVHGEGEIATAVFRGGPTDTRAARELDVRPIEAAVSESGVWAVMPRDGNPLTGFLSALGFRGFSVIKPDSSEAPPIDDQVRGVLRAMFASGVFDREGKVTSGIETAAHRQMARTAADQSMVLLKNEGGLLPFDKSKIHSIAVIGPGAGVNSVPGGSHAVAAQPSVTPIDALKAIYGPGAVFSAKSPAEAARADVAIVFAGSEADQDDLIEQTAKANPHVVVVLNSGGAVAMDKWIGRVPAILEAWYPGEEGGDAIADVLSGAVNPSGRLPIVFPPFALGYGLSYTQFEYSGLTVMPPKVLQGQFVEVTVNVRNTGSRAGRETAQLYLRAPNAPQNLRGIQQIQLNPGESKRVAFTVTGTALSRFDGQKQDWVEDQSSFEVRVGSSSRDIRATGELSISE